MLSCSMQSTLEIMRYFIHIFCIWFVFTIYLNLNSHISRSQQCYVNRGDIIRQCSVTIYRDRGPAVVSRDWEGKDWKVRSRKVWSRGMWVSICKMGTKGKHLGISANQKLPTIEEALNTYVDKGLDHLMLASLCLQPPSCDTISTGASW